MLPPFPRGDWEQAAAYPETRPGTEVTVMPSGLRVVSQETYTYMSAVGVVVAGGSSNEMALCGTRGGAALAETCAWRGTPARSTSDILKTAEACGAYLHANSQREQTLYCVDALRDNLDDASRLLAEAVMLGPDLSGPGAMDEARESLRLGFEDATQDARVREAIHQAAYGPESPLGAPLLPAPADLGSLGPETLLNYRAALFRPDRTVLAGAGVAHAELVDVAERHFEPLLPPAPAEPAVRPVSHYRGGEALHEEPMPTPAGFAVEQKPPVRVAVAMRAPDGGWHSKDLIALCVLQTLLGGGDSFSAGGPGKGMYSRLYREVLNRYYWVEACEAFVSVHDSEGLLGIVGAAAPTHAGPLTEVLAAHLLRLGAEPVARDELQRAKNMLKVNVLTQLESRLVLFEDIARQFATYGRRQTLREMTSLVDTVTEEDILRIGQFMAASPPSIAAHGEDLSKVPRWATVRDWRLK